MTRSRRFAILAERDINKETFVEPWAEAGLIVTDSPYDPKPGLRIENGQIVEMDGKQRADFDALDLFIAEHSIDLEIAEVALGKDHPVDSNETAFKTAASRCFSEVFQKANWIFDYDQAREAAKKSDKLIFAYFTRSYSA